MEKVKQCYLVFCILPTLIVHLSVIGVGTGEGGTCTPTFHCRGASSNYFIAHTLPVAQCLNQESEWSTSVVLLLVVPVTQVYCEVKELEGSERRSKKLKVWGQGGTASEEGSVINCDHF